MIRLGLTLVLSAALTLSTSAAVAPTLPISWRSDAATLVKSGTLHSTHREVSPRASRSYARWYMSDTYGWTASEFRSLDLLWKAESNWRHTAKNPHSSAYGIPQILGLKTKDPKRQIELGLKYIKHRYSKPSVAWAFFKRHGWY